jgi:predicted nucleic acid-binding protein
MNNAKLSLIAASTAMMLGTLSGCGGSDDPNPESIPKVIETTHAEISGNAVKGTMENANISFEQLNGTNININSDAKTDTTGKVVVDVASDVGFGFDSVIKIIVSADSETLMICDAAQCGDSSLGDMVSGTSLSGTELYSLSHLKVPYGNSADGQADTAFMANALTTLATQLIERDIAAGKNVSTLQLLELAQAEYSALVLRALGFDDSKTNVFTEQLLSSESIDNFVIDETCEDQPVIDENEDPVLDEEGNPVTEEVCEDVYDKSSKATLSLLNASFAYFAPGFSQKSTLVTAYSNLEAALSGNEDALTLLRQPLYDAINNSSVAQELGIIADDVIDLTLPLFEVSTSSGPVQEITSVENMATAIITARNRIGDGEAEAMAFDGDVNTKWLDHNDWAGAPTTEDPSWIQVQFAEPQAVTSLFITSANDGPGRDPENFNLQGSLDGETWINLAEFIGESFDERFERKEFRFSNGIEYSYYRLNITKNKGDDGLMQLAEIAMVGPIYTSVDHTDPVGTGTITARNRIGDGEAETMAFDNDPETKWLDHNDWAGAPTVESPSWVQVDFTEAVAVNVLGLTSANDGENRDPENFTVVGSNDGGQTWISLATWIGESFDERFERKLFNFDNTLAFNSYRLNITKNKGDDTLMQVGEIEFIGPKMPDLNHALTAGTIITARNRIGDGEAETMAFDGDVNTKWLDHNDWAGAPTEEAPSWVQVQLPAAAAVNKLAMTSANDGENRDPENFNLEGSKDGTTWVALSSWIGESFDERFERKLFTFSNDLAYNYYRLNITKNKGDDTLMQVAEIELIGPEYSSIDHARTDGTVITARNRIGDGEAESMAFDGNLETKWLDHNDWAGAPTTEDPSWVQVDLPNAKIVGSLAITSANDADGRDPENFNIQGSNDGGVTWTTIGDWVGESWDNRLERKLFDMGNGFAFESYRINITKNKGDDTLMQIAEIELIGPDL